MFSPVGGRGDVPPRGTEGQGCALRGRLRRGKARFFFREK